MFCVSSGWRVREYRCVLADRLQWLISSLPWLLHSLQNLSQILLNTLYLHPPPSQPTSAVAVAAGIKPTVSNTILLTRETPQPVNSVISLPMPDHTPSLLTLRLDYSVAADFLIFFIFQRKVICSEWTPPVQPRGHHLMKPFHPLKTELSSWDHQSARLVQLGFAKKFSL